MSHQDQAPRAPTIDDVLADPCTSYWLKAAIRAQLKRDPVDAVDDAELLLELMRARLRMALGAPDALLD